VKVPAERLPEQSRLEIRYSPTLAMAMIDALPYMVDYPYGCTDATLNRFLPTVITQKVLLKMGVNLKDIEQKRTNLNAQEIGEDKERAKQWGGVVTPFKNPVFDEETVRQMVKAGIERLGSMQCSDGGWGWFSGWGEHSWAHTTALVAHGLQIARANDVAMVPGMLERGVEWLKNYQAGEVQKIKNAPTQTKPWKDKADALDALVYMVLVDEKLDNKDMREFLYRDRNDLPVYAKAMFGIALHKVGDNEKRDMIIRNIEQFLVQDDENQTAYLRLPENNWWWCWYGSEYEAQSYYLKLLTVVEPKAERASRLVKYLLNNRKHATYWNSTRDSAVVIEAFADYIKAAGEDAPDMTVQILVDGKQVKEVKIDKANLFSFDNKLVQTGKDVTTGEHKIEFRKKGQGPLYFNAYLTNFTLEDPIAKAGLEIKVNRAYYKLVEVDKKVYAAGSRGQVTQQKVEKYERKGLANLDQLKSGDLVEIEMVIDSKNDYEYILFEDMKPAGCEPVEVRSGYNGNDMGAYVEFRDERVCFFVRALARGKHSVSYRMRAEIPGKFSALPAKGSGMYAPELKANSDEFKLRIED
jgi:alpha-2-macroglobulin